MEAESRIHPNYRGMLGQGTQASNRINLASTEAELGDMSQSAADAQVALNRSYGAEDSEGSQSNPAYEAGVEELGHS